MRQQRYVVDLQRRLARIGFAPIPAAPELQQRQTLAVQRAEDWGALALGVAPPDTQDEEARSALIAALGRWVSAPSTEGERRYAIAVFPFSGTLPEAEADALKALRTDLVAGAVIPWIVDLRVGLIDQHTGPPRIPTDLVRQLTELDEEGTEQVWEESVPVRTRGRLSLTGLNYLPATRLILATTIAYYIWVVSLYGWGGLVAGPRLQALLTWGANHGQLVIQGGQHWRLFTHMLLHGGLLHLGFNMWALWNVGRYVELVFGSSRMALIYLTAGITGGLASTVLRPRFVPSVGASGAVLGLMGALLYFAITLRGRRVDWRELLTPVIINVGYGFFLGGLIDNYAHIGGLAGGFVAAFITGVPGERRLWRLVAMGALALLLLVILSGAVPLVHRPLW